MIGMKNGILMVYGEDKAKIDAKRRTCLGDERENERASRLYTSWAHYWKRLRTKRRHVAFGWNQQEPNERSKD
jgi:hypothetical protein